MLGLGEENAGASALPCGVLSAFPPPCASGSTPRVSTEAARSPDHGVGTARARPGPVCFPRDELSSRTRTVPLFLVVTSRHTRHRAKSLPPHRIRPPPQGPQDAPCSPCRTPPRASTILSPLCCFLPQMFKFSLILLKLASPQLFLVLET